VTLCVIDASMPLPDGEFAFCPLRAAAEGEEIVTGLTMIGAMPPDDWEVVGAWHPDGQAAVYQFARDYEPELHLLANLLDERDGL
jgi:hypothetical protein